MADSGSTPGNSGISGITDSFGNLVGTLADPKNQANIKAAAAKAVTNAGNVVTGALDTATAIAAGTAGQAPAPVAPPAPPTGQTPPPVSPPPQAPATPADPNAKQPEQEEGYGRIIAQLMFKFMPDNIKEWGLKSAIPMATTGKAMMEKNRNLYFNEDGTEKTVGGIGAFLGCISGKTIKQVPKVVFEYAELMIDALGMGQNKELAMAISLGFINFIKDMIHNFFPSMGIKVFNAVAGKTSFKDLIPFADTPQTMLGLFKMAPKNEPVDTDLYNGFKTTMKATGVPHIEDYFSGKEINYNQFLFGYAHLGRDMTEKWGIKEDDFKPELLENASEILESYGITDDDGALAYGLAASAIHTSKIIASSKPHKSVAPEPATDPAPVVTQPPAPAATPPKPGS